MALDLFDPDRLARRNAPQSVLMPRATAIVPRVERVELGTAQAPLTASAQVVPIQDPKYAQELRTTRQTWQQLAFDAFHSVGEISDALDFSGRALSMVTLYPCVFDETGKPTPDDDPNAKGIVADLGRGMERGGMDGTEAFVHDMTLQLSITGEGFLIGWIGDDGLNRYDVLSISELGNTGSKWQRRRPGMPPEDLPPDAFMLRVWRADPEWSHLAWSGMRAILDDVETLKLLVDQVAGTARSRLARSGMWAIPSEATKPPPKPGEPDWLTSEIIEHFSTPVTNPRSAMAVVPYILRMPSDLIEKIKQFGVERLFDEKDIERIAYFIRRIAQSLDVSVHRLLGFGKETGNHWDSWLSKQDEWQSYLEPKLKLLLGALTRGWYHPMLKEASVDPNNRGIWYDASRFLINPNRVQDAKDAWDRGAVKYSTLRRELGFTEDDAPDEEEWMRWAAVKLGDSVLLTTGQPSQEPSSPPQLKSVPSGPENVQGQPPQAPGLTAAARPLELKPGSTGHAQIEANGRKVQLLTAARPTKLTKASKQLADLDRQLLRDLSIAANDAVRQALERAGNKLRSRIEGNPQRLHLADKINGVSAHLVPQTLKAWGAAPRTLGIEEDELIDRRFRTFAEVAGGLLLAAQRKVKRILGFALDEDESDLDDEMDQRQESHRSAAMTLLMAGMGAFAASRLYAPTAEPPEKGEFDGLLAPKSLLREAMAVAGGARVDDPLANPILSGVGNGAITASVLEKRDVRPTGYVWIWSGSDRPYPEHEELDGTEFVDMLDVAPNFPGDHQGCGCTIEPAWGESEGE